MARSLPLLLVVLFVHLPFVIGHGRLTKPVPRGTGYQEGPVAGVNSEEFVCRNKTASAPGNWPTHNVGDLITTQWTTPAAHVGDCAIYMTLDGDKPYNQMVWFKIAQISECKEIQNTDFKIKIPDHLPSSAHAILRWEWYALHIRPTLELYSQCWDIKLTGLATGGSLPGPTVAIPGHLPANGELYRRVYYPVDPHYFTGPPMAVKNYNGPAYSCQNSAATCNQPTTAAGDLRLPSQSALGNGGSPSASPPTPSPPYVPEPNTYPPSETPAPGSAIDDNDSKQTCTVHTDCASDVCGIDGYCAKTESSGGLGAGGIAAIVFACLFVASISAFAVFLLMNKKELSYMRPFKNGA